MMLVVPDFVCQDSHDLFCGELLHQRVVQHNPLSGAESGEVGVGMCAAFRRIHHVDVLQFEIHAFGEVLYSDPQFPFGKWSLLVEQRHDQLGIEVLDEQREYGDGGPGEQPEAIRCEFVDPYAERKQRAQENDVHPQRFELVGYERFWGSPVETESILDDEGGVYVEREVGDPGYEVEYKKGKITWDYNGSHFESNAKENKNGYINEFSIHKRK